MTADEVIAWAQTLHEGHYVTGILIIAEVIDGEDGKPALILRGSDWEGMPWRSVGLAAMAAEMVHKRAIERMGWE